MLFKWKICRQIVSSEMFFLWNSLIGFVYKHEKKNLQYLYFSIFNHRHQFVCAPVVGYIFISFETPRSWDWIGVFYMVTNSSVQKTHPILFHDTLLPRCMFASWLAIVVTLYVSFSPLVLQSVRTNHTPTDQSSTYIINASADE